MRARKGPLESSFFSILVFTVNVKYTAVKSYHHQSSAEVQGALKSSYNSNLLPYPSNGTRPIAFYAFEQLGVSKHHWWFPQHH